MLDSIEYARKQAYKKICNTDKDAFDYFMKLMNDLDRLAKEYEKENHSKKVVRKKRKGNKRP